MKRAPRRAQQRLRAGNSGGVSCGLLLLELAFALADRLRIHLRLPLGPLGALRDDAIALAAFEVHVHLARRLGGRLGHARGLEADRDLVLAWSDGIALAHIARALAIDLRDGGTELL